MARAVKVIAVTAAAMLLGACLAMGALLVTSDGADSALGVLDRYAALNGTFSKQLDRAIRTTGAESDRAADDALGTAAKIEDAAGSFPDDRLRAFTRESASAVTTLARKVRLMVDAQSAGASRAELSFLAGDVDLAGGQVRRTTAALYRELLADPQLGKLVDRDGMKRFLRENPGA